MTAAHVPCWECQVSRHYFCAGGQCDCGCEGMRGATAQWATQRITQLEAQVSKLRDRVMAWESWLQKAPRGSP